MKKYKLKLSQLAETALLINVPRRILLQTLAVLMLMEFFMVSLSYQLLLIVTVPLAAYWFHYYYFFSHIWNLFYSKLYVILLPIIIFILAILFGAFVRDFLLGLVYRFTV